jgi:hypothetical protein
MSERADQLVLALSRLAARDRFAGPRFYGSGKAHAAGLDCTISSRARPIVSGRVYVIFALLAALFGVSRLGDFGRIQPVVRSPSYCLEGTR